MSMPFFNALNEKMENSYVPNKSIVFYTVLSFPLFYGFEGFLVSILAELPVSLSNHVGFTPWLTYVIPPLSPEGFIQLKTGWTQDAWLQWLLENWYFNHNIARFFSVTLSMCHHYCAKKFVIVNSYQKPYVLLLIWTGSSCCVLLIFHEVQTETSPILHFFHQSPPQLQHWS